MQAEVLAFKQELSPANIDPNLNSPAKKMSEAAPAPEMVYKTNTEPQLRWEKSLPESPMSKQPLSAMAE